MRIYKPKILKNGAIGGYYKNKKGKLVWRLLTGPKKIKGGEYSFENVNKSLTSNINFLNLAKLIEYIRNKFKKKRKLFISQ